MTILPLVILRCFVIACALLLPLQATAGAGVSSSACPSHAQDSTPECPCCPESGLNASGCLSACAVVTAADAVRPIPMHRGQVSAPTFDLAPIASRSDLPPNPPPIR